MAAVEQNGKTGFVDESGALLIPCRLDSGQHFSEGLAACHEGDRMGYINKLGKWVIKPQFFVAEDFSCGRAVVRLSSNGPALRRD